ncbi:hypothetical protein [Dickeya sp. NCPPB 3274]|uniref:hypothetical protein n=1 Tax=Dickeya sp. NCPPB 3274 TaxID=568766 RepID=UPI00039E956E|nr:hypothetical protein [Dickeya sp. NCPPB 3274]
MKKPNKKAVKKTMLDLFKILIFLFITFVLFLVSYLYKDTNLYKILPIAIPGYIFIFIIFFMYDRNPDKVEKEEEKSKKNTSN